MSHIPRTVWRSVMAKPQPYLDGVFAIDKPAGKSSAQAVRDLQAVFKPSALFKPWFASLNSHLNEEDAIQGRRQRPKRHRRGKNIQVSIGHGGTLDPEATGVLILGIGRGTKDLKNFLGCKKTYDAVLLFGAATDSYDAEGRVVKRGPYEHVTRQLLEEKMAQFRGPIMQKPPVYSALRVNGKRMYEYAREGGDIPDLPHRPVECEQLELLDWFEGGTHEYRWPEKEVEGREKKAVSGPMGVDQVTEHETAGLEPPNKRVKTSDQGDEETVAGAIKDEANGAKKRDDGENAEVMSGALQENGAPAEDPSAVPTTETDTTADTSAEPTTAESSTERPRCLAPAARIRMTVSSGFYVRSLCHDLGLAVGSLGIMSTLVRTHQGQFELGKNVLEMDMFSQGEDTWSPPLQERLAEWDDAHRDSRPDQRHIKSVADELGSAERAARDEEGVAEREEALMKEAQEALRKPSEAEA